MHRFFLIVSFSLITVAACAQQKINYGNNKAAGKYYTVRGIKMYCETYGSGTPLLMIHGNGGSIAAFRNTIPYFAKKYKVIVTDSRAHGKTIDTNDSLSFEMMADDEAALLDAMHIDSADVIGWSDGGIISLVMAMRHPKKVRKLAATGANLWPDSTALIPSLWKEMKQQYDEQHTKVLTTEKERNNWKVFMLDWLQPNIPLADLKKISCLSLIINGDHDLITLEHAVQIFQHIPQAYLWVLPNSGHGTLEEYKDEFNKKVDNFFQQPFHKWE